MACDSPVWIKSKGQEIPVPCNRCAPCMRRRVNEWVFRVMYEEKFNSSSSYFVTLTYDTSSVPLTSNGFMSLRKSDFQKFMKRLRKIQSEAAPESPSIRYYACGEYGGKTNRPHYHAIIFNVVLVDFISDAWSLAGVQLGSVHVGSVTGDSVAYTMKYIEKDSFAQKRKRYRHARDDRELEFALMSKGIGQSYLDNPSVRQFHLSDLSRNYVVKDGGYKVAMPRYYRKKLFSEAQLDEQREIISRNVEMRQNKERYLFVPSHEFSTYADRIDAEKEGREQRFKRAMSKRNVL